MIPVDFRDEAQAAEPNEQMCTLAPGTESLHLGQRQGGIGSETIGVSSISEVVIGLCIIVSFNHHHNP